MEQLNPRIPDNPRSRCGIGILGGFGRRAACDKIRKNRNKMDRAVGRHAHVLRMGGVHGVPSASEKGVAVGGGRRARRAEGRAAGLSAAKTEHEGATPEGAGPEGEAPRAAFFRW